MRNVCSLVQVGLVLVLAIAVSAGGQTPADSSVDAHGHDLDTEQSMRNTLDVIDRVGFDRNVDKTLGDPSEADALTGVKDVDRIIQVHVPADDRSEKDQRALVDAGNDLQGLKGRLEKELDRREQVRAGRKGLDGKPPGQLASDPDQASRNRREGIDNWDIYSDGVIAGITETIPPSDPRTHRDQLEWERKALEEMRNDIDTDEVEQMVIDAWLQQNAEGKTISEAAKPEPPPAVEQPPPPSLKEPEPTPEVVETQPPPEPQEVVQPPPMVDETEYVDETDTGSDSNLPTKSDLQDQLDYTRSVLSSLDPKDPDDAWAIQRERDRQRRIEQQIKSGQYRPDPPPEEPPFTGTVPGSLGGVVSFVDEWEDDQYDDAEIDRDLNDAASDLDDATNAGDDIRDQARHIRNEGGADARSLTDKTAQEIAAEDQKDSWGNTIVDGLMEGLGKGAKEFGEAVGHGAADEILYGDDDDSGSDTSGTVPPATTPGGRKPSGHDKHEGHTHEPTLTGQDRTPGQPAATHEPGITRKPPSSSTPRQPSTYEPGIGREAPQPAETPPSRKSDDEDEPMILQDGSV